MAVETTNNIGKTGTKSNGVTWWISNDTFEQDVAFNLNPIFNNATREQVFSMLKKQVHISVFKKVSIKMRMERESGAPCVLGYINCLPIKLTLKSTVHELSDVENEIEEMFDRLNIDNISKEVTQEEADSMLDMLG